MRTWQPVVRSPLSSTVLLLLSLEIGVATWQGLASASAPRYPLRLAP